jgi:hypothetical protein
MFLTASQKRSHHGGFEEMIQPANRDKVKLSHWKTEKGLARE